MGNLDGRNPFEAVHSATELLSIVRRCTAGPKAPQNVSPPQVAPPTEAAAPAQVASIAHSPSREWPVWVRYALDLAVGVFAGFR